MDRDRGTGREGQGERELDRNWDGDRQTMTGKTNSKRDRDKGTERGKV